MEVVVCEEVAVAVTTGTYSLEVAQIIDSLALSEFDSIHAMQIITICNSPQTRACLSSVIAQSHAAAQITTSLKNSINLTWENAINEWVASIDGFVPSETFKEIFIK